MFLKQLILNFIILFCLPILAQAQLSENDKLRYVEVSIASVNSFNESLSILTAASESEFDGLFKRTVESSTSSISKSADIHSDLTIDGMVQRNQKMISPRYYFEIYNKFFQRNPDAELNLRYLNWQLMIEEDTTSNEFTGKARVLTSYNGVVKDGQSLATIVLEFDLVYGESSKGITCEIVSLNNTNAFMIDNFTDEFSQEYIRQIESDENANPDFQALLSPIVENNCSYYNRAISNHVQRADSLFEAKNYEESKIILDQATEINKNYLARHKFYRTQRDNIDELLSNIEKAEALEQKKRFDHLQLRLITAKELATNGEVSDALLVLDELIAQKHELAETTQLKQEWGDLQSLMDRVKEELEQGTRLWALEEFINESTIPHIRDYFKGLDLYENVTGEQIQRSHMLDEGQKALSASIAKNKDYIPSYVLRIAVNKAIISLNPTDKTPFVDQIYEDYEKICSSSEHRVAYTQEAFSYYEEEEMHDKAVDMLAACWNMTRIDLEGMDQIAMLLSEQYAFDGKENYAKKILSELVGADETLRKDPEFWEARLKTELIIGTKESKQEIIADFRSQFDPVKISATYSNLHDFFNAEGDQALADNRYADALKFYKANQLIEPTLQDDLNLGRTANAMGQYNYAEKIYFSSLERHPESDELYLAKSDNLLDAGQGGYDLLKLEGLAYTPSAGIAENLTFLRAASVLDKKKAKSHLKHIKTTFGDLKNEQIYAKHLYQWYAKRNFDKATKFLEKYTGRTRTGKAYFELACWYMGFNPCYERDFQMTKQALKNKSTAIKNFKEAAEVNKPVSEWMLNRYLANIYFQEQDFKRSEKYFELALESNQEDIESCMKKALGHFYSDDYDECISTLADISLLDFVEFCRQDENNGKELLGVRILMHVGADYLTQEDTQRSTKEIEEYRKMSEDNTDSTTGSAVPLSIANVAYWYILKKDEAKDENEALKTLLLAQLPEKWLNLDLFEKTEVYKALQKNSNFKQAWKAR